MKLIPHKILSETKPEHPFDPPFCPHKDCEFRGLPPKKKKWFRRMSGYQRKGDKSFVRRYMCTQTSNFHTFSDSSFTLQYWLKKRDLLPKIAECLNEQSSLRGIARTLKVSESLVSGQVLRIGRHCMILHHALLAKVKHQKIDELCFDEMESWEISQHVPTTHGLFIHPRSRFMLSFQSLPINRKGKMTIEQKISLFKWNLKYGRSPQNNSYKLISQSLNYLQHVFSKSQKIKVYTDEKSSYKKALANSWQGHNYEHTQLNGKTQRHVYPMNKINQIDVLIRQRCATMRRETLDFMRRHCNTNLRHFIYMISHNLIKPLANTKRSETPATRIGIFHRPVRWEEILTKRLVEFHRFLPNFLKEVYFKRQFTNFYGQRNTLFSPIHAD